MPPDAGFRFLASLPRAGLSPCIVLCRSEGVNTVGPVQDRDLRPYGGNELPLGRRRFRRSACRRRRVDRPGGRAERAQRRCGEPGRRRWRRRFGGVVVRARVARLIHGAAGRLADGQAVGDPDIPGPGSRGLSGPSQAGHRDEPAGIAAAVRGPAAAAPHAPARAAVEAARPRAAPGFRPARLAFSGRLSGRPASRIPGPARTPGLAWRCAGQSAPDGARTPGYRPARRRPGPPRAASAPHAGG
jgi:hypothetical protein